MSFHISYARDFEKRFSFQYYEPLVLSQTSNMAGTCDLFAHNIGRKNFFQNPCSRTVECHKRNIAAKFLAFVVNDFLKKDTLLRGPGRLVSIFIFFLTEETVSYQELFSKWKNIVLIQTYHIFKSRKYIHLQFGCGLYLLLHFLR